MNQSTLYFSSKFSILSKWAIIYNILSYIVVRSHKNLVFGLMPWLPFWAAKISWYWTYPPPNTETNLLMISVLIFKYILRVLLKMSYYHISDCDETYFHSLSCLIFHCFHSWGYVCDDHYRDINNIGRVACRNLGRELINGMTTSASNSMISSGHTVTENSGGCKKIIKKAK